MILFFTIIIPVMWLLFLSWTRTLVDNIISKLTEIRIDLADIKSKLDGSDY